MINVTKPDLPDIEKYVGYLKRIWSTRWLSNDGELVKLLERKLEDYLGVGNMVIVTTGTLALQLALKAFELKGEVITTPFIFSATTNVIVWERLMIRRKDVLVNTVYFTCPVRIVTVGNNKDACFVQFQGFTPVK